jgi:CheY-like chemotaxis protein
MDAYSGRGSFVVRPVDLGEMARELVTMLGVALPKNARLTLDLAPSLPSVEADRGQMEQVVMNLVTNAAESLGGAAGTVHVRTRVEAPDAARLEALGEPERAPGRYVVLEVSDTGCGMDDEGPAASLRSLLHHEGRRARARHERRPGDREGARRLRPRALYARRGQPLRGLPACLDHAADGAPSLPCVRACRPRVAPCSWSTTKRASVPRSIGLSVTSATALLAADGAEGLTRFDAHRGEIVAVLLDLTMPGMSGLETLAALRARSTSVPVLLTSGDGEEPSTGAEGATGFLPKPYGIEERERTLASVIHPT